MILSTVLLSAAFLCSSVNAHGYNALSRSIKCKDFSNYACGVISYEPQSLEAVKGFPEVGPPDGKIASANLPQFSELDEQTPYRWIKTTVQEGDFDFTWKFTANHATTGYEYFITKPDWNPSEPLTRAQFDLTPFCTVSSGGVRPPLEGDTHTCTLPSRDGYQVILAVWIIDDTVNAFYNVIDVDFGGENPPSSPVTTPAPTGAPTLASTSTPVALSTFVPTPGATGTEPTSLCSTGLPNEAVDNCTAFVFCENGAIVPNSKVNCQSGLLFNNQAQICDWDYNVDCADGPSAPATTSTTATTTTYLRTRAPTASPTSPKTELCSLEESLEPVEDCKAFVSCDNGEVVPNSKIYCPSGLLFSVSIQACDWPDQVTCH